MYFYFNRVDRGALKNENYQRSDGPSNDVSSNYPSCDLDSSYMCREDPAVEQQQ